MRNVLSFPHRVTRLVFDTGQPYEKFCGRYEAAVPPADPRWLGDFPGRHSRWPGTAGDLHEPGPHGFVLYWRGDMTPLMTPAGEVRPCTAYLMGSQVIPDKIYRSNPAVMLYSPLRTLIYIGSDDRTRFAVDQPSTVLADIADPAIALLGADLDRQLADLLDALGVETSQVLSTPTRAGHRAGSSLNPGRAHRRMRTVTPPSVPNIKKNFYRTGGGSRSAPGARRGPAANHTDGVTRAHPAAADADSNRREPARPRPAERPPRRAGPPAMSRATTIARRRKGQTYHGYSP